MKSGWRSLIAGGALMTAGVAGYALLNEGEADLPVACLGFGAPDDAPTARSADDAVAAFVTLRGWNREYRLVTSGEFDAYALIGDQAGEAPSTILVGPEPGGGWAVQGGCA